MKEEEEKEARTWFAREGRLKWGHPPRPWESSWTPHDRNQQCRTWTQTNSAKDEAHPRCRWLLRAPPRALHEAKTPCSSHPSGTWDPEWIAAVRAIDPHPTPELVLVRGATQQHNTYGRWNIELDLLYCTVFKGWYSNWHFEIPENDGFLAICGSVGTLTSARSQWSALWSS